MRAILTYHSIDTSGSPISVSPDAFARQVAWLASGRVRVLPLLELLRTTERDAVALTFDDAFANFATEAWPLLRDHGLPATVFVVTQRVGKTNAWRGQEVEGIPTLPLMDWPTLDRIRTEGVELGGHTRTHQSLMGLESAYLVDEIAGCAHDLNARYGAMPATFAYPYGEAPPGARKVAQNLYTCACTTDYGPLGPKDVAEALPRIDMFYFQSARGLAGWGSPLFRAGLVARRSARAVRTAARAAHEFTRRR